MTQEMNSGLSAEGKSGAYPFNADNQAKPDWCNYNDKSDDIWQAKCIGYPLMLYDCVECTYYKNYKPKERILNPDIAEFFWNCCNMERLK